MREKAYSEMEPVERLREFFAHGAGSYLSKAMAALHFKEMEDALRAAREEGRREGFEKAREQGAMVAERDWDNPDVAGAIRAMRDEAGEACGACGHAFHDDNACPACRPGTCVRSDS